MLWLAAGVLGATVMPHNLYLYSALVKDYVPARDDATIGEALRGVNIYPSRRSGWRSSSMRRC